MAANSSQLSPATYEPEHRRAVLSRHVYVVVRATRQLLGNRSRRSKTRKTQKPVNPGRARPVPLLLRFAG